MTAAQGSSRVSAGTTCCVRQSLRLAFYFFSGLFLRNKDNRVARSEQPCFISVGRAAVVFGRLLFFVFSLLHNRAKTIQ